MQMVLQPRNTANCIPTDVLAGAVHRLQTVHQRLPAASTNLEQHGRDNQPYKIQLLPLLHRDLQ